MNAGRIKPDEEDNSEQTVQELEGVDHRGEKNELLKIIRYVDEQRWMMHLS